MRFSNLDPAAKPKKFLDVIRWKLTTKKLKWPKRLELKHADIPPSRVTNDEIRISYVGHVTFLIQTHGLNILTDPVWSERASPFSFIGPKRVIAPGINFDDLPKIDIILISHNHYDHMDIATIRKLWKRDRPLIITPLGNDVILSRNIKDIEATTLNWYENTKINDDVSVHLEPAQHWSARGLFDVNKALWGTFIIKTPLGDVCFIGDSGYDESLFKEIGKRHPNISVSLIPIGAYKPRWFMKDVHMSPEEAVLTHLDLHSSYYNTKGNSRSDRKTSGEFAQALRLVREDMPSPASTDNAILETPTPYIEGNSRSDRKTSGEFAQALRLVREHKGVPKSDNAILELPKIYSIASHFGVFPLADDGFCDAVLSLDAALKERNIEEHIFKIPIVGQEYSFFKQR